MREFLWEPGIADGLTDLRSATAQGLHVIEIDAVEFGFYKGFEPALFEELPVGVGGDDEAAGDLNAYAGEVLEHFAEGGALAADEGDIIESNAFEGNYDSVLHESFFVVVRKGCLSGVRE